MTSTTSDTKRSTAYQLALFALAVIVGGAVVLVYPDPKPAPPPPLPANVISIVAITKTNPLVGSPRIAPAPDVPVQFFAVGEQGQVPGVTAEVRTNNSGLARVRLERGLYVVKYGDTGVYNIIVTKNSTLTITKYEIDRIPESIKVLSLTKDWQVAPSDYVLVKFKNNMSKQVTLVDAFIDGKKAQSIKCKIEQANQELPEYEGGGASCDVKAVLEPAADWDNILGVPGGVYIPWSQANETLNLALRLSYTDAEFKPDEAPKQG
ncbi:MAG: hypothetical protein FJ358_02435 [Thaumarchaeota archaeon]|nr:hypothetical protein [Nitrososphaerota archaeon]